MAEFFSGVKDDFIQSFVEGDRWLLYLKGIGVTLQVAAIKYVRLAIETASSHITPDIRVCIKIHSFAFRKITGANLFKRCAGVVLSLQNSRLCQKLMRRRG